MPKQRGVALIIVLLVLIVMAAATVGILRSANVGLGIAGNLGFKQNATSVADNGVEAARVWLLAQAPAVFYTSQPAQGYVETWNPAFDPATYNWSAIGNSLVSTLDDGTGNQVRYVIHRLCSLTGSPQAANQECVFPPDGGSGSRRIGGSGSLLPSNPTPIYRVTVRVDGPRNTVSFTQVMLY